MNEKEWFTLFRDPKTFYGAIVSLHDKIFIDEHFRGNKGELFNRREYNWALEAYVAASHALLSGGSDIKVRIGRWDTDPDAILLIDGQEVNCEITELIADNFNRGDWYKSCYTSRVDNVYTYDAFENKTMERISNKNNKMLSKTYGNITLLLYNNIRTRGLRMDSLRERVYQTSKLGRWVFREIWLVDDSRTEKLFP